MPNIGAVLKSEISRLSKRVVRENLSAIQSATSSHRKQLASLKKQVADLEREIATLRRLAPKPALKPVVDDSKSHRFNASGLKSLRRRLGLSAEDFGRLIEVSAQSVYNWESKKTVPRPTQIAAIADLRGLGKKEARARLELIGGNRLFK
jgi:DNA-binding XRE family transcriptional regulator